MSFEDFLEAIHKWMDEINRDENVDGIILDKKYFTYDEKTSIL